MSITRRSLVIGATLAPAVPAFAEYPTSRVLLVAGQSLALQWQETSVQEAFRDAGGQDWTFVVAGVGGSTLYENGQDGRYWLTNEGTVGPALSAALAEVNASPKPVAMVWSHGQSETFRTGDSAIDFVARYVRGVRRVTKSLRTAIAGNAWATIPCYIQPIGWRMSTATGTGFSPFEYDLVRLAQTQMVAYHDRTDNFHMGAPQGPWVKLQDAVHPTLPEAAKLAANTARAMGLNP